MQTIIRVEKLAKTFNQHQALHAVDLNIHHGEMVAVLIHLKYEKNREDIGLFGIWRD